MNHTPFPFQMPIQGLATDPDKFSFRRSRQGSRKALHVLLAVVAIWLSGCKSDAPFATAARQDSATQPAVATSTAAPTAAPRLADNPLRTYLLSHASAIALTNVADDGRNTYLAFAGGAPENLTVFDSEGRPLQHVQSGTIAGVRGVHKGLLIRNAQGSHAYAAPDPQMPPQSRPDLASDVDVLFASNQLQSNATVDAAMARAIQLSRQKQPAIASSASIGSDTSAIEPDGMTAFSAQEPAAKVSFGWASAKPRLTRDELAELIRRLNSASLIRIVGRTDATGRQDLNQALAMRRATGIRQLLLANGIATRRIDVEGHVNGAGDQVSQREKRAAQMEEDRQAWIFASIDER